MLTPVSKYDGMGKQPQLPAIDARQTRRRYFPPRTATRQAQGAKVLPTHVPASVTCPPVLDPFGRKGGSATPPIPALEAGSNSTYRERFSWLDRQENNNSGETSSRKVAAKEHSRREVENWYFMHFRFRTEGYQSFVYAIRQSSKVESIFSEDNLDKWTLKMRFRIRRSAPLKEALMACVSRLGLDGDPDVIFCLDGFFGDSFTGRVHNKHDVPNRMVQATSTCRAMGLCNGSCVFVSRVTSCERSNAAMQMQLDLMRLTSCEATPSAGGVSSSTSSLFSMDFIAKELAGTVELDPDAAETQKTFIDYEVLSHDDDTFGRYALKKKDKQRL